MKLNRGPLRFGQRLFEFFGRQIVQAFAIVQPTQRVQHFGAFGDLVFGFSGEAQGFFEMRRRHATEGRPGC